MSGQCRTGNECKDPDATFVFLFAGALRYRVFPGRPTPVGVGLIDLGLQLRDVLLFIGLIIK